MPSDYFGRIVSGTVLLCVISVLTGDVPVMTLIDGPGPLSL